MKCFHELDDMEACYELLNGY